MTEERLKALADDWDKISKGRADTTWESGYRRARAVCALELRAAIATPAPAQPEPTEAQLLALVLDNPETFAGGPRAAALNRGRERYAAFIAAGGSMPAQPEGAQEDEPTAYFLRAGWDGSGDGTKRYEQVADEHKNDPDVIPLYLHPSQSAGAAAPDEGEAKRWLVFNVGCIECGVSSNVVGRYASEDEARKVAEACEEVLSWREGGQNEFEVFDLHAAQPEEYVAALSAPKGEAA